MLAMFVLNFIANDYQSSIVSVVAESWEYLSQLV